MQVISGTKSPLSWVGGKSLLAAKILPLAPAHTCYVEVFAGAAWMLFKKPESKAEVINDINVDLVTLYRVVQHHLDEFVRYFKWMLVAREEFERLRRVDAATLFRRPPRARLVRGPRCWLRSKRPRPRGPQTCLATPSSGSAISGSTASCRGVPNDHR